MSMLDSMMREGGVPALMESLGDSAGVQVYTANGLKPFTATAGKLEVERVESEFGSIQRAGHRETCRVTIACPRGAVGIGTKMLVAKYTVGDASTHEGQSFFIQSVESSRESFTAVVCWRQQLSTQQAQGTEIA